MTADQVALTALLLAAAGLLGLAMAAWRLGTLLAEHLTRTGDALDDAAAALDRAASTRRTDTADLPEVDEPQPARSSGHRATRAGGGRR